MPLINLVESPETDTQKMIFAEINDAQGRVPNLFRAYAHQDQILEASWERVKTVMMRGQLTRRLKEAIAVAVSVDNGCGYCVAHHSIALRRLGLRESAIEALLKGRYTEDWDDREWTLIRFSRRVNTDPESARELIPENGVQFSPAELVEAVAVVELFSSFNKFIACFDVPLE